MLKPLLIKQGEVTYVTEELTKIGGGVRGSCWRVGSSPAGTGGRGGLWERRTGRTQRQYGGDDAFPSFLHGQEE